MRYESVGDLMIDLLAQESKEYPLRGRKRPFLGSKQQKGRQVA